MLVEVVDEYLSIYTAATLSRKSLSMVRLQFWSNNHSLNWHYYDDTLLGIFLPTHLDGPIFCIISICDSSICIFFFCRR